MSRERSSFKLDVVNILIACTQRMEGEILRSLIDLEPDMNVSGLVFNTQDLLEQAQTTSTDLVLVEWSLLAGPEETIQAFHSVPGLPDIIAFGRQPGYVQEALDAGVNAYFWTGQGPKALLTITRKQWLDSRYAQ